MAVVLRLAKFLRLIKANAVMQAFHHLVFYGVSYRKN